MQNKAQWQNLITGWETSLVSATKSTIIVSEALYNIEQEGDAEGICFANLLLSMISYKTSDFTESLNFLEVSAGISDFLETGFEEILWCMINAVYIADSGDYERALDFCDRGLAHAKRSDFPFGEAELLKTAGTIYRNASELKEAENYYNKSLKIFMEIDCHSGIAAVKMLLAELYFADGNFISAETLYAELQKINMEDAGDIQSWYYCGMARILTEKEEFEKSIEFFNNAIEVSDDKVLKQFCHRSIGRIYSQMGKNPSAYDSFQKAIEIASEVASKKFVRDAYRELYMHLHGSGDAGKLGNYFNLYNELNEQVTAEEKAIAYNHQSILYGLEREKRKKEIDNLRDVELKDAKDEIIRKNKDLVDSIRYAYRIQKAISPPKYYVDKLLPQNFILYKPKDVVSGDFYFVDSFQNDKVIFSAVDCTGHGVPGALMSVIGYNWLVLAVRDKSIDTPGKVLSFLDEGVNNTLRQTADESGVKDSMDLAVCVVDFKERVLQYAGAYNPLYYISKGELHEIKADKTPIGVNTDGVVDIFTDHTVQLDKGDTIYIFSDGYADQFGGPKNKKFKYRQLKDVLLSIQDKSMEEQYVILDKKLIEWMGPEEQVDDIIVIGVKV